MQRSPAPLRLTAPEALAFLAAALLSFAWLATDLVRAGPITRADAGVMAWVHAHSRETLTRLMVGVTHLHSYTGVCLMAAAAAGVLIWQRRAAWLPFLLMAVPGGLILNALVKYEFHRSRPVMESPLPALHTFSFPSGHTAGATVWWGFVLTLLFAYRAPVRWRAAGVVAAVGMVAFTALSRVYLGVHYPSDVLAAVAEGCAWLMFCYVLLGRHPAERVAGPVRPAAAPATTPAAPAAGAAAGAAADARIEVIANSSSGQGCAPEWARDVEGKLREHGLDARVTLVHSGEEILSTAKQAVARGADMVVASGGDGTVSAVASQLAGTRVTLGVLPMGTLNHFAKDLGIPIEVDAALGVLARGHAVQVDVAEVNGRVFINNSSLGLYPDIVLDRERQRRRLGRGKWGALLAASLHAAQRYPVLSFDMEVDGKPISRRSAFAFIGNNEYTMEGFEIGGRSQGLADGKLSLYITQRTGRFGLLRLALRALFRRLRQAKDFDILTAQSLVVNTRHRHMRVATDGEVSLMETPLTYRIRPAALRVIVPAPEEPGDNQ
ncbi:diacylglycerol kinase family protein [Caenimonas aquaedulcis]|uniref:Phosphatase PAP2 family protein n=1 Tax=Caenimonas aquaedulcis TaxID=2793270 RepID=A0A931H8K0_9BURK|nr:diacylglycerol kinase family protein [Caenimonas aquaedulcis]MBG9390323.1 phosphatase PAP2 family protein [Caenimonas aquaedulcis]